MMAATADAMRMMKVFCGANRLLILGVLKCK